MDQENDSPVVLRTLSERVALVTINRPKARNAINSEVANLLEEVLNKTECNPEIDVVILTGSGGTVFSAGADLKEVAAGRFSSLFTECGGFAGFVHAKRRKPWIAAVDGLALAGGCEIALACDLIVASESAEFGLPEVSRGLIASAGGLYRLTRSLPKVLAIELILTAGRLPAARAMAFGLVNRITEDGCAVDAAHDLALQISVNAPLAVRESLGIARLSYDLSEEALQKMSDESQERLMVTKDFTEGPKAFAEKRNPEWSRVGI